MASAILHSINNKIYIMIKNIFTLLLMILYKVVYLEVKDKEGYYLIKRKWVWFIMFIPILAYRTLINLWLEILNLIEYIFSYDSRWISVNKNKPNKLTFKQKKYLTEQLMS